MGESSVQSLERSAGEVRRQNLAEVLAGAGPADRTPLTESYPMPRSATVGNETGNDSSLSALGECKGPAPKQRLVHRVKNLSYCGPIERDLVFVHADGDPRHPVRARSSDHLDRPYFPKRG